LGVAFILGSGFLKRDRIWFEGNDLAVSIEYQKAFNALASIASNVTKNFARMRFQEFNDAKVVLYRLVQDTSQYAGDRITHFYRPGKQNPQTCR
jgi:hypothetical protein